MTYTVIIKNESEELLNLKITEEQALETTAFLIKLVNEDKGGKN